MQSGGRRASRILIRATTYGRTARFDSIDAVYCWLRSSDARVHAVAGLLAPSIYVVRVSPVLYGGSLREIVQFGDPERKQAVQEPLLFRGIWEKVWFAQRAPTG